MAGRAASALILLLSLVAGAQALSPPWIMVTKQMTAALAADRFVQVAPLLEGKNQVVLPIDVAPCCTAPGSRRLLASCIKNCKAATAKAKALATLLSASATAQSKGLSEVVKVKVTQGNNVVLPGAAPKSAQEAATLLQQAMLGNAYFQRLSNTLTADAVPVFTPKVAQYWADDIGEVQGLQTVVVADLMEEAFNLSAYELPTSSGPCGGGPVCLKPTM